jgi:hypothetical protein
MPAWRFPARIEQGSGDRTITARTSRVTNAVESSGDDSIGPTGGGLSADNERSGFPFDLDSNDGIDQGA